MKNLVTIAAAATAIMLSTMSNQASAQNGPVYGHGEPGMRQGNMCWKQVNNDGFTYYGYWVPCNGAPAPVRRPTSYEN